MKELLEAKIFSGFQWTDIIYQGSPDGKLLRFEVNEGGVPRPLCLVPVLAKEEKTAWESFKDMLDHTAGAAQAGARGFFGFDVLSVELRDMRSFDPGELSRLLVNHSRELGPGAKRLVRYGQLFGLLHYRAPAEWGKIEVTTHAEFFDAGPDLPAGEVNEESVKAALLGKGRGKKRAEGGRLDLLFKKIVKAAGGPGAVGIVHDMSARPVCDPASQTGRRQVEDWLAKEAAAGRGPAPEIYVCHAGRSRSVRKI